MPNPKQTAPNFGYQQPSTKQIDTFHAVASEFQTLSGKLVDICPAGPELNTALENLRTAQMWVNQSIVAMGLSQGASR